MAAKALTASISRRRRKGGAFGSGVALSVYMSDSTATGITTAATIWLAAALGMGIGGGYYLITLFATPVILLVLWFFTRIENWIGKHRSVRDYEIVVPLNELGYFLRADGRPGSFQKLLAALAKRACVVVTDDYPSFFLPRMVSAVAARLPVRLEQVDSNGLLPLRSERTYLGVFLIYPLAAHWRNMGPA